MTAKTQRHRRLWRVEPPIAFFFFFSSRYEEWPVNFRRRHRRSGASHSRDAEPRSSMSAAGTGARRAPLALPPRPHGSWRSRGRHRELRAATASACSRGGDHLDRKIRCPNLGTQVARARRSASVSSWLTGGVDASRSGPSAEQRYCPGIVGTCCSARGRAGGRLLLAARASAGGCSHVRGFSARGNPRPLTITRAKGRYDSERPPVGGQPCGGRSACLRRTCLAPGSVSKTTQLSLAGGAPLQSGVTPR